MSLSDEQIARIAGWNDQFEASDWHETAIELARELQSLRASRRPDMSDEAVEAAQRCLDVRHALDFSVEDVHTIARALLAHEAQHIIERALKTAGQPSADGGKEGK